MGFETYLFKEQPVDDNLICSLCLGVFNKPTTACLNGHVYCYDCVQASKKWTDSCPSCRGKLLDPPPLNRPLQNLLLSLPVCCKHYSQAFQAKRSKQGLARHRSSTRRVNMELENNQMDKISGSGCNWEGTLSEYLDNHEESCEYNEVECPYGCGLCFVGRELEAHSAKCDSRIIACSLCEAKMKLCFLESHKKKSCPEEMTTCKFCNIEMKRKDLGEFGLNPVPAECHGDESHITGHYKECSQALVRCEFHAEGCNAIMHREDLAAHHVTKAQYHASLLAKARLDLSTEIKELKWERKEICWEIPYAALLANSNGILRSNYVSMCEANIRLALTMESQYIHVFICAQRNRSTDIEIKNVTIQTCIDEEGNIAKVNVGSSAHFFLDRGSDYDDIFAGRFTCEAGIDMISLTEPRMCDLLAGAKDGLVTIISAFEMRRPQRVVVGTCGCL